MVKVKNANVGQEETYEKEEVAEVEKVEREKGRKWQNIGWGSLLTVNELYYPEMIYEFYANLHKGRVTSKVGGRDISFDDRMLNIVLGTPENSMRFYTKNKKCFDLNLYICYHIGIGKIYNKHTLKRMGFSRNEEEEEDNGQDAMNIDEEISEEEHEEETFSREMGQKKRQERVEEGQSSGVMSQLMEMMSSMQASMNSRFDALDGNY
ncbi:hypothetical protein M9H77_12589 [Catharanthus roseus]|uniref:Uncharacterized protein n=1 Tax=Catharanthus roseus TaxID=4058 RepID=A0ACC0BHW8_CATRO|nr:hypothetical protein M9H77_12589 [Catharanthus roseus]